MAESTTFWLYIVNVVLWGYVGNWGAVLGWSCAAVTMVLLLGWLK
jgi:hypothetical protein